MHAPWELPYSMKNGTDLYELNLLVTRGFGEQNPGLVPGWLVQAGDPETKKMTP